MKQRNPNFENLEPSYLFPQIRAKAEAFAKHNPEQKLLNFGIGDVSLPLVPVIVEALEKASKEMGTEEGFHGYGPEMGYPELNEKISEVFYHKKISSEEIFVSDGAKCDIARLINLFGHKPTIGVQNPCYPAIADSVRILSGAQKLQLIPCDPTTGIPLDLENLTCDILIIVNPNNPTGHLLSRKTLESIVQIAREKKILLIYDGAYREFISQPGYPRSIFDIEGSLDCAIEIGSLSKSAGFTGLRLGWVAMSRHLHYKKETTPVLDDYKRLIQTTFNGASYLSQKAALAALSPEGHTQTKRQIHQYLQRTELLRQGLETFGLMTFGGKQSPFIWARLAGKTLSSWDLFHVFLENLGWITTPGSGFGSAGEGFVRFSGFAKPKQIQEALDQMKTNHHIRRFL